MKKKLLSVLLCAAMAATMVVGCGGKEEEAAAPAAPAETETEAPAEAPAETGKAGDVNGDGKIVVGYISKNIVDPFHAPINDYAEETFEKMIADGKIDDWTGVLDGETDPNKQIDRASDCISKACDYVIILPAEATASDTAVTQMADAGIKVIVVNSKTDSTDAVALGYVGPDDVEAGRMLANWVIENKPEGGKYIHCLGVIGNSAQIQRGEGIKEVMDQHPEFEMVGESACDWQADKAADAASDAISKNGDELVAIICDNDDMSSSAQKTCNDQGRSDIVCVGVDGNQNPLQMVKDGEMGATVLQDGPGQVAGAVTMIETCLAGGTPEKEIMVPFVLVTKDNVDQYLK